MLKELSLKNYRSCIDASLSFHPKLSVLIGPNGSGKTNIMQGIMLLNKLNSGGHRFRRVEGERLIPPQVSAIFQLPKFRIRLQASIDASTDQSNADVVRGARQRWFVTGTGGKRARFEMPIEVFQSSLFRNMAGTVRQRHFRFSVRYGYSVGGYHLPIKPPPDWCRPAMIAIAKECDGMAYYSASQFTNPAACPASFEIEREEGGSELPRLRGHAKLLYDMYSAESKRDSNYAQFLDIIGSKGLRKVCATCRCEAACV